MLQTDIGALLPAVYVDGAYFGDVMRVQALGELDALHDVLGHHLQVSHVWPYRSAYANLVSLQRRIAACTLCSGAGVRICAHCHGGKRSSLDARLRCTQCNERGLILCPQCSR